MNVFLHTVLLRQNNDHSDFNAFSWGEILGVAELSVIEMQVN